MNEFDLLSAFHFLRPWWLLSLVAGIVVILYLARQRNLTRQWKDVISPHLLKHLIVQKGSRSKIQPFHILAFIILFGAIALAGPTWEREPLPFAEDDSALVIVLNLSNSMKAIDIQPSRVERSKQKIKDLMIQRGSSPTGMIAYAKTAHLVLPIGNDSKIIDLYTNALDPNIMPEDGNNILAAIELAVDMLKRETSSGSILIITDNIESGDKDNLNQLLDSIPYYTAILGVGTNNGGMIPLENGGFMKGSEGQFELAKYDKQYLNDLSGKSDIFFQEITVDDTDVRHLSSFIKSELENFSDQTGQERWKDFGYWLLYPIALLSLFWFRRGWIVRWLE